MHNTITRKFFALFLSVGLMFAPFTSVHAGLETGTYISSLVATNPTAADPQSQGDDHLRLIKATILATFPNITGAVSLTHTQINLLDSKSLAATGYQKLPSGLIMNWGTATTNGSGVATITFAQAFPTGALNAVCGQSSGAFVVAQGSPTTTQISASIYVSNTASLAGAGVVMWCQVLGY